MQTHELELNVVQSRDEQIHSILTEIREMLRHLLQNEEPSHLDLNLMAIDSETLEQLQQELGEGDVEIESTHSGYVHIQETAYSAVWWVRHLDDDGEIVGEFIEVNYCPEILLSETEDVVGGVEALKARLFTIGLGYRQKKRERKKDTPAVNP